MNDVIKSMLKTLLVERVNGLQNNLFKRNILKEYLQVVVLDFIYSHPKYSGLVFYGGSCLAQCYGLPRLSEDLDFVDKSGTVSVADVTKDLAHYFNEETDLPVKAVRQKFRVYLKFPILKELGLAVGNSSDLLFLKVEIFSDQSFCTKHTVEVLPLFKFNRSVLVKAFDLPTLMATKLRAVLYRRWEKRTAEGEILVRAKGRDYFDLMWYLQKGIRPNLDCLGKKMSREELKDELLLMISRLDEASIRLDLEPLIADGEFVRNLSKNLKGILIREVKEKI